LIENKALVVVIGSQAANVAFEGGAAYAPTKAALDVLANVFMMETRHAGVRTCVLELGAVRNRPKPDDAWKLDPRDVASIVTKLVKSPESAMQTRLVVRPPGIPLGEEAGPERLHRL
jgi:NADP-dependent 3-hydroxy acid dehydrogenase YdfG